MKNKGKFIDTIKNIAEKAKTWLDNTEGIVKFLDALQKALSVFVESLKGTTEVKK